jgi:quercetin dioxygenase-like cupin family protein
MYPSGGNVHYLATGESTANKFGLYRWEMATAASGPEPHFHKTISESFYVLTGAVRLYDGEQWVSGTPGDFLFVPEGGIHAFRNESGESASMLILFAPGAPREDYFETLARVAEGLLLGDDEKAEFYIRHDTYWV